MNNFLLTWCTIEPSKWYGQLKETQIFGIGRSLCLKLGLVRHVNVTFKKVIRYSFCYFSKRCNYYNYNYIF